MRRHLEAQVGVFVCWVKPDALSYVRRIERVMQRHHYLKDFSRPSGSLATMLEHDAEYATLMAWFVSRYRIPLTAAGYTPARGDAVGVCLSSDRRGFLMYSVGSLVNPASPLRAVVPAWWTRVLMMARQGCRRRGWCREKIIRCREDTPRPERGASRKGGVG